MRRVYITLDGVPIVYCAPNLGVFVSEAATDASPRLLAGAVRMAFRIIADPEFQHECHGSGHPMFEGLPSDVEFTQYGLRRDTWRETRRQEEATSNAKREALATRRREFSSARPDLILALIARGDPYICAQDGCETDEDLTIDHVRPVVLGGGDDLGNLRFMCRSHNSAKGARV